MTRLEAHRRPVPVGLAQQLHSPPRPDGRCWHCYKQSTPPQFGSARIFCSLPFTPLWLLSRQTSTRAETKASTEAAVQNASTRQTFQRCPAFIRSYGRPIVDTTHPTGPGVRDATHTHITPHQHIHPGPPLSHTQLAAPPPHPHTTLPLLPLNPTARTQPASSFPAYLLPAMAPQPTVDVGAADDDAPYAAFQSPHGVDRVTSTDAFIPPSLQPSSSAYELPDHDTRPALVTPSAIRALHDEDKADEYQAPSHKTDGSVADKVGLALSVDPKHAPLDERKEQALATSLSAEPTAVHPPNGAAAQHKPDESEKSEHGALDLTTIPTAILATDPRLGLSSEQAAQRIVEFGYNEIQGRHINQQ